MAKQKATDESWSDKVEKACRKAIASIPGINSIPEEAYCNAVIDGCGVIVDGAECRLGEIGDDEDEE